ncbi:MAG: ferric reductase-like transmembrane domain-containing protein [Candidatus Accumulibacter sp.]|nr:ferric reductase-like transmembrane domain-containing protein [Accumulibacter sp.]
MKQRPLTLLLAATTLLYAACTVPLAGWPENFWGWRHELMLLSGVQLMAVMSAAMLLAMRLVPVEQALGGLDKLYALHKRLGIAAGVLLSAHWLIKLSPKLLLALQWVEPRVKRGGAKDPLVSLAKDMGERPGRCWRSSSSRCCAPCPTASGASCTSSSHRSIWSAPFTASC